MTSAPAVDVLEVGRSSVRRVAAATAKGGAYGPPAPSHMAVVIVLPGIEFAAPASELEMTRVVDRPDVAVQILPIFEVQQTGVLLAGKLTWD